MNKHFESGMTGITKIAKEFVELPWVTKLPILVTLITLRTFLETNPIGNSQTFVHVENQRSAEYIDGNQRLVENSTNFTPIVLRKVLSNGKDEFCSGTQFTSPQQKKTILSVEHCFNMADMSDKFAKDMHKFRLSTVIDTYVIDSAVVIDSEYLNSEGFKITNAENYLNSQDRSSDFNLREAMGINKLRGFRTSKLDYCKNLPENPTLFSVNLNYAMESNLIYNLYATGSSGGAVFSVSSDDKACFYGLIASYDNDYHDRQRIIKDIKEGRKVTSIKRRHGTFSPSQNNKWSLKSTKAIDIPFTIIDQK